MPFSAESDIPILRYGSASSGPSILKELYSVQVPSNTNSLPQSNDLQGQTEPPPSLGLPYSIRKYDRPIYSTSQSYYTAQSSYSTLEGWAGVETLSGSSSRSHGEPATLTSASLFGQHPEDWGNLSTVSAENMTGPTDISLDPTLRWYEDVTVEGDRFPTQTSQYSNNLESLSVNENRRLINDSPGHYEFSFPDTVI
jgi:hypothetical protein